jgi:cation diffusion facilitator family transporter
VLTDALRWWSAVRLNDHDPRVRMHMHDAHSLSPWQHDHRFGLHRPRAAEGRVKIVTAVTLATMIVEIIAGQVFGSMALLADGLHMGSHAVALGLSALAYIWMRKRAGDARFAMGTGKISSLAGYTGALLLLIPVGFMVWESVEKLVVPTQIDFTWALAVAVIGLVVNGFSAMLLSHADDADDHHAHSHGHDHGHSHGQDHGDQNLRSAYLHVAADMLTSVLAIVALLGAAHFGWIWLDPAVGLVGAAVIVWWAIGLLRDSSHMLLDRAVPEAVSEGLRQAIEGDADNRLADMHVWSIGPGIFAASLSVVTHHPKMPDYYKDLVPSELGIRHITVEVNQCREPAY